MGLALFRKVDAETFKTTKCKKPLRNYLVIGNIRDNFKKFPSDYTCPGSEIPNFGLSNICSGMVLERWLYNPKSPKQLHWWNWSTEKVCRNTVRVSASYWRTWTSITERWSWRSLDKRMWKYQTPCWRMLWWSQLKLRPGQCQNDSK